MRFYISKVIGTGTDDDIFRAKASEYVDSHSAVDGRTLPTGAAGFMLVMCNPTKAQHDAMVAATGIKYLKFEDSDGNVLALNDTLNMLSNPAALNALLENNGVHTDGLSGTSTLRKLINRIVKRCFIKQILIDDDLTESFDTLISSIPRAKLDKINAKLAARGMAQIDETLDVRTAFKRLVIDNAKSLKNIYDG